ncbi:DUF4124 domain-containing protein [Roseateles amylovorans]|uniref:DUF4124 domain-containing protein n=1 Tax=Roseateles amylovorans TaxID=2978473 RepID=A0ABY6B6P1_9BURK|nr:DUF4124 domain-containing protein [Roseateles amylovorans]UXH80003.1 DUF4124 domain-containing protein [Roseateles amylovorans]
MTSLRLPLSLLCSVLLLALAPSVQAQWKWRDAQGRVQYSDRPPPGAVAEKDILQRPSPNAVRAMSPATPGTTAAATGASAPGRPASDASSRDKVEQERKAAEDKVRKETDAENCRVAQNRMRMLESGVRMRQTDDKGESKVVDDAARQEQTKQMQAVIAASCK